MYLVLSVLCLFPESNIIASGQVQMIDVKVLPESGDDGQCPSVEERVRARNEMHQIVDSVITTTASIATLTCTYYYTCNGTPGWRRVAFVNMTDTSYNCPNGLNLTSYSKRTCGKSLIDGGCSSTTFNVGGLSYSRVCGRIRGYQYGSTSAFGQAQARNIESHYVDGISLTHGTAGSRQHIWTFAAGLTDASMSWNHEHCPCDTTRSDRTLPPAFVGNDYFCETSLHSTWESSYFSVFHSNNVLWDGQDCTSTSTCCQFNNPPWFTKNLTTETTEDIELRICASNHILQEDVPLELIELYVQ